MRLPHRVIALALYAALLGACGGPELQVLPPGATVLAFGDSLTYGTGARPDGGYPRRLQELTGLTVINGGVPGEVSEDGRQRLPELLEEHQPDLVVLVHGGNDTLRNLSKSRTAENLQAMIDASRAAGAQVIMLGVPGRSLTLSAPDYYDEVAEMNEVPIDSKTLPRLMRDRSLKSDPVHFNSEGYGEMAIAVQELLREAGALP